MNLPSPAQLKDRTSAFLTDCREPEEQRAAEGLADCDPEMKCVRNDDGRITEVQVVFRCRTRKTFEKYKEREHDLGPWRERDAFHRVRSAVSAVLGREWKLGHFDFVPECGGKVPKQKAPNAARTRRKGDGTAPKSGVPSLGEEEKERSQRQEASRLFALINELDGEGAKPPLVLTVFQLYCVKNLSAEKVCQRCKCGKGTVLDRLKKLRKVTGMDPRALRALSGQFERIEKELSDPRARRIDRESAMDQPGDDESDQN